MVQGGVVTRRVASSLQVEYDVGEAYPLSSDTSECVVAVVAFSRAVGSVRSPARSRGRSQPWDASDTQTAVLLVKPDLS